MAVQPAVDLCGLTEFFLFELQRDEAGERPFCSTLEGKIAWVPNRTNAAEFVSDLPENRVACSRRLGLISERSGVQSLYSQARKRIPKRGGSCLLHTEVTLAFLFQLLGR